MRTNSGKAWCFGMAAVGILLFSSMASAATITLYEEDFGSFDATLWTTTDTGFETYTASGFSPRGMASTDPDGTPLLGGMEVLANATDVTNTLTITLGDTFDSSQNATLKFLAGQRISGSSGGFTHEFGVVNKTTSEIYIAPTTKIANMPNYTWAWNEYSIDLSSASVGDEIEISFHEVAGTAARGLQLSNISFTTGAVPEPTTLALLAAGGVGLLRRRKK